MSMEMPKQKTTTTGMVGKGFLVLQSSQVWRWEGLVDWQVSQSHGLVEVVVGSLIFWFLLVLCTFFSPFLQT